jgi:hypothetical protein
LASRTRASSSAARVVSSVASASSTFLPVVGLRQLEPRLGVGHLGLDQVVVELDQHVTCADDAALGEVDLLDAARDLRGDLHGLVGAQAADGANVRGRCGAPRGRRFHGDGALGALAAARFLRLRLVAFDGHRDLGRQICRWTRHGAANEKHRERADNENAYQRELVPLHSCRSPHGSQTR